MGFFDDVTCEYPLPELSPEEGWVQNVLFQTKSLDPSMVHYVITVDGKLLLKRFQYDVIPEAEQVEETGTYVDEEGIEQQYTDTPTMRVTPLESLDTEYHGDINFYALGSNRGEWYEFWARFTEGKLTKIKRVYRDDDTKQGTPTQNNESK